MIDRLHVITGGPGSGKTSLIAALAGRGFRFMPEGGRSIIRTQQAIGGTALPSGDRDAFAELMLGWELRSHDEASAASGPVFFDRGIPDVIGYRRLYGLNVSSHLLRAAALRRYARQVFVAPHWPAIFEQDAERRQDAAEAEATCHAVAAAYQETGYDLVSLPLMPVSDRLDFILSRLD